jgi:hypothetical protein
MTARLTAYAPAVRLRRFAVVDAGFGEKIKNLTPCASPAPGVKIFKKGTAKLGDNTNH